MVDQLPDIEGAGGLNREATPVLIVGSDGQPVSIGGSAPLAPGTNKGGTITTGGSAQQLAAANASRSYLKGQNLSTGDLWINEVGGTAAAAQPSYRIPAGGIFGVNTNQAVSIWGATTGQAFSATEG